MNNKWIFNRQIEKGCKIQPKYIPIIRKIIIERIRHIEPGHLYCRWSNLRFRKTPEGEEIYIFNISFSVRNTEAIKQDLFTQNHYQWRDFTFSFAPILKNLNATSAHISLECKDWSKISCEIQLSELDIKMWKRNLHLNKILG